MIGNSHPNRLKRAVAASRPVFGLFCSIPLPLMIEMIGCAGYDFVIIDIEHTLVNPETLENMVRAADAADLVALVRVPDATRGAILRALDAGAQGIVVPRVRCRADAEMAVRAARYHPYGERGLNAGRAARFGKSDLAAELAAANREVMVVLMIEDRQGVEHREEILAVPGVDMVLEGAADLSQSLGVPWQTRHPVVREALHGVHATASRLGVPYCAIPRRPEDVEAWQQRGVRTFVVGEARGITFRALQGALDRYHARPDQTED